MSINFNDIKKLYVPYNGVSTEIKQIYINGTPIWQSCFSFKYSGSATLDGTAITPDTEYDIDVDTDFVIRFLTSGTLTIISTGADNSFDIFSAGGGGGGARAWYYGDSYFRAVGGGGGGYTTTSSSVGLENDTDYAIVVGAGGPRCPGSSTNEYAGFDGYTSSFGSLCSADGGKGGGNKNYKGGNGGSGGGGEGYAGGSNGGNGGGDSIGIGGIGQGTTTYEFADSTLTLYSGGGGGGVAYYAEGASAKPGGAGGGAYSDCGASVNTAGGGGGHSAWYAEFQTSPPDNHGGSGIVCLRNHRS